MQPPPDVPSPRAQTVEMVCATQPKAKTAKRARKIVDVPTNRSVTMAFANAPTIAVMQPVTLTVAKTVRHAHKIVSALLVKSANRKNVSSLTPVGMVYVTKQAEKIALLVPKTASAKRERFAKTTLVSSDSNVETEAAMQAVVKIALRVPKIAHVQPSLSVKMEAVRQAVVMASATAAPAKIVIPAPKTVAAETPNTATTKRVSPASVNLALSSVTETPYSLVQTTARATRISKPARPTKPAKMASAVRCVETKFVNPARVKTA